MNGVTVLYAWSEQIDGDRSMYLGAIIVAIMTIMLFLNAIKGIENIDTYIIPYIIVCIVFGFLYYSCWSNREPRYQECQLVTIDDTVNLNEFNEKYKIIKQEGKIFTIAERED